MNYQVNKNEIINKKNILLKEYKDLLYKTLKLTVEICNITEQKLSLDEIIDWVKFNSTDEEIDKLFRLAAALQYVEMPHDKDVISNLQENIEINNLKIK